jgi:Dolichyl-phosphate-mannose-protein mannosyltransferase
LRVPSRRPSGWTLGLAGVLVVATALRLWGIKHGLPYAYNVDENANFVPSAIAFFSGDYNPHYFVNPPAFPYLLHIVFAFWYGGGWPFGSGGAASEAYAIDPTEVFVIARVTCAVLGVATVALVYATGSRLYDRRVGLAAAALLAVAFLPVFYSHLALNDVPALFALMVSVYGSAGVLMQGRLRDYTVAGAGLGLACATKYTAGIVVLPLLVAALVDLVRSRPRQRTALAGLVLSGAAAVALFVLANPYALFSFSEFWADVKKQESAAGDLGKLGLTYDTGIEYYLWVLTWGVGWVPAIASLLGGGLALRDDVRKGLFLVPWPVLFILFMGLQDRYFGRWLLPALPAIVLLAGFAAVRLCDLMPVSRPVRTALVSAAAVLLVAQGAVYAVHLGRVLSRDDTRNLARAWMVDNVPAGSKIVVEPVVPGAWFRDVGRPTGAAPGGVRWRKFIVTRTTLDEQGRKRRGGVGRTISIEDYERTTRPALVSSYARGGYCWVMIGSTQYGRAFAEPEEVPRAIDYYRSLPRHGDVVFHADPYKRGEGPVEFNFDWSFDYYPLAYERPGPTVIVYRLREAECA